MFQQARRAAGFSTAVFGFAVLAGCASDHARQALPTDAGTGEVPPDETGGQGLFTNCVDGRPVVFGSSMESGGVSPDIPDTVVRSMSPPPALSGGTLLALADGKTVALSDPERDRIYVVDLTAGTVLTVALQPGDEPGRLAEDGSSRVHVVLRRGGAIAAIDPATGTLTSRRAVCSAPRGIAYQRGSDRLHVACAGGELVSLPAGGGPATRTLKLERDLRDVVVRSDGALLVSTFRKAEVLVVGSDGKLSTRLDPGSGRLATPHRGPLLRTPSVAWRMVPVDPASGSVLLLHQTGVADIVDLAPGGYAGSRDCGGIVQPGLSVLAPGAPTPVVASGLGALSLAIDVALSPDHQKVALAVAGNSPRQGPTLLETGLDDALPAVPVACASPANDIENPPPGQVVAVGYAPTGVLFAPDARAGGAVAFRHRARRSRSPPIRGPTPGTPCSTPTPAAVSPAPPAIPKGAKMAASGASSAWALDERNLCAGASGPRRPSIGTAARSTSPSFSTTCSAAAWPARC